MTENTDGSLWIGTRKGLSRLKDGKFRHYTDADIVSTVHEDRENTVWAGTDGGLIRVKGDRVTRYTTAEGGTGGYILNQRIGGLQTGVYELAFTAGTEPYLYKLIFQVG